VVGVIGVIPAHTSPSHSPTHPHITNKRTNKGLADALAGEAQAREEADCVVLDAMLEAQKRLQVRVLCVCVLWGGGWGWMGI
jgi:hypothetical protein